MGVTLILGGARSGKSRFAQDLAGKAGNDRVLFVATAEAGDNEMSRRIRLHQQSRPAGWRTLERPLQVGAGIVEAWQGEPVILVDCLTLLVSNVLMTCGDLPDPDVAESGVRREVIGLLEATNRTRARVIVVSGEVGQGLVPETSLGRLYRDLLGWANQQLAAAGGPTYLMVAGLAIDVQRLATSVDDAARKEV